jgi:hypothetical protein
MITRQSTPLQTKRSGSTVVGRLTICVDKKQRHEALFTAKYFRSYENDLRIISQVDTKFIHSQGDSRLCSQLCKGRVEYQAPLCTRDAHQRISNAHKSNRDVNEMF